MSVIISKGKLDPKSKCSIFSHPRHDCKKKAEWFLFYHGEHQLNTTQFPIAVGKEVAHACHLEPCVAHLIEATHWANVNMPRVG